VQGVLLFYILLQICSDRGGHDVSHKVIVWGGDTR